VRANSLHSLNSQGHARLGSGDMSFGTPPGGPSGPPFEATGLSRFHPHQQGGAGSLPPDLSRVQLQQLAQSAGVQHPPQQADAANQAMQARLFAYQQQQHQQVSCSTESIADLHQSLQ